VLLALPYSIFRLLLNGLVDRRQADADLRLEFVVLRHQLGVLQRHVQRPRWRSADRLLLAGLSRCLPRSTWSYFLVSTETLLRWHRDLVRRKWALFARRPRLGRPGLIAEPGELMRRARRPCSVRFITSAPTSTRARTSGSSGAAHDDPTLRCHTPSVGLLSDFFAAAPDELARLDPNRGPAGLFPTVQAKGFDPVELSQLEGRLTGQGESSVRQPIVAETAEAWVVELGSRFAEAMAAMDNEQRESPGSRIVVRR
jgi:hypothetical protein